MLKQKSICCFTECRNLLDSLPLPTFDYGVAKNHLTNARMYQTQGEFGAAKFEFDRFKAIVRSHCPNINYGRWGTAWDNDKWRTVSNRQSTRNFDCSV